LKNWIKDIEADRAAQRQAGREEAEKQAFDLLQFYGVPKERACTVVNGIDVLVTRLNRSIDSERGNRAMEAKRYAEVVEALEEILPTNECDVGQGLAPYYIHSDTIKRARKALDEARKG
jgi:hypothetical protein